MPYGRLSRPSSSRRISDVRPSALLASGPPAEITRGIGAAGERSLSHARRSSNIARQKPQPGSQNSSMVVCPRRSESANDAPVTSGSRKSGAGSPDLAPHGSDGPAVSLPLPFRDAVDGATASDTSPRIGSAPAAGELATVPSAAIKT